MQYSYCLFCETKKCKNVAASLEKHGVDRAFSPQIVRSQRKQGKNIDRLFDFLPGYVFAFTSEKIIELSILRVSGVIRILGTMENDYCLEGSDSDFAFRLLNKNGIIDPIRIINIGDQVTICDPLFSQCQGKIIKIDNRKRRANIEFIFGKMLMHCWVACDILSSNKC